MKQKIKRKRQFAKPRYRRWVLIILAIFLAFLGIRLISSLVKLQEVTCQSQFGKCSEGVEKQLSAFVGRGYVFSYNNIKQILGEDPAVEKYSLQVELPLKIKVDIIEKKPKFAISVPGAETIALVDERGRILNHVATTGLPVVYDSKLSNVIGGAVSPKQLFALNLLYDLYRTYQIKSADITDDGMVIELEPDLKVIFPLEGDSEVLMGSIILIYNDITSGEDSELNTKDKIIGTIDLRFKNPILY